MSRFSLPLPLAKRLPPYRLRGLLLAAILAALAVASPALAATWVVAPSGGDFSSIQAALDVAVAGDVIQVRAGAPYFEKVSFPRSGDAIAGPIVLEAFPGEQPILDGTGVAGSDLIRIDGRSYVQVKGLELRNNQGVSDGSGIRVLGSGTDIVLEDNRIHEVRGRDAMGITVYGTDPTAPIQQIRIQGNEIWDCDPHPSEALVLNGNVTGFEVLDNYVHDVNNIGIDLIGGETDIQPDPTLVARNGVVRGNRVERANEKGGHGFAGGIYVDGGRDILIERNEVAESDLGIEVGAENAGTDALRITVRSNVLHHNERAGLVFGGFSSSVGRTRDSVFRHNTLYENDTAGAGFGELWIQYAEDNRVEHNVVVSTGQGRLVTSDAGNVNNLLDWNLYFAPVGAGAVDFTWNGVDLVGFAAYRAATGQDASSSFADPLLVDPVGSDFHLSAGSPALDAGSPLFVPDPGELDIDGEARSSGLRVDLGADEISQDCGDGVLDPGESCDDGNLVNGDGCDANCTPTGCGNGIATAGEGCDDGNLVAGDCCDALCQPEPDGSSCDDGDLCSQPDQCVAGLCVGPAGPAPACRGSLKPGRSQLVVRDKSPDSRDRLIWRYRGGEATSLADFGDPLAADALALCGYRDDGAGGVTRWFTSHVPAGGLCAGRPCWKPQSTRGYRYKDRVRTPDGADRLVLRSGADGATNLTFVGRGERLGLPVLPVPAAGAVRVQLVSESGVCWESVHSAPFDRNQSDLFRDRAD